MATEKLKVLFDGPLTADLINPDLNSWNIFTNDAKTQRIVNDVVVSGSLKTKNPHSVELTLDRNGKPIAGFADLEGFEFFDEGERLDLVNATELGNIEHYPGYGFLYKNHNSEHSLDYVKAVSNRLVNNSLFLLNNKTQESLKNEYGFDFNVTDIADGSTSISYDLPTVSQSSQYIKNMMIVDGALHYIYVNGSTTRYYVGKEVKTKVDLGGSAGVRLDFDSTNRTLWRLFNNRLESINLRTFEIDYGFELNPIASNSVTNFVVENGVFFLHGATSKCVFTDFDTFTTPEFNYSFLDTYSRPIFTKNSIDGKYYIVGGSTVNGYVSLTVFDPVTGNSPSVNITTPLPVTDSVLGSIRCVGPEGDPYVCATTGLLHLETGNGTLTIKETIPYADAQPMYKWPLIHSHFGSKIEEKPVVGTSIEQDIELRIEGIEIKEA